MEQIKELLKERENYLLQIKKEKEQALEAAPEGSLRICCGRSKTQYYQRNDPKDFSGIYIRENDRKLAQDLAQKDYDQKVLCSIKNELEAIGKYRTTCPVLSAEQIYEKLHRERQKLITPIIESEQQFACEWENFVYQGKEIDESVPEMYTAKGERVRSKSEVIIADILGGEGIPYRYECPIYIRGIGKFYPDFTVLNVKKRKELYWEHFGMMDDLNYVEKAIQKISIYERNGLIPGDNLILTYESRKNPINQKLIRILIQKYLK